MGHQCAFFYGTLMAPTVLSRVLHGDASLPTTHLTIIPAMLSGYTRHKVLKADYPAIIPATESSKQLSISSPGNKPPRVRGVFVTGLTSFDVKNLDIFEGDQYERRKVAVDIIEEEGESWEEHVLGDSIECDTYVWIAGEEGLENEMWSFDDFVREKMYRWAQDSTEYSDLPNGSAAVDTDDEFDPTGGRGVNTDMDAKLKGKATQQVLEAAV